MRLRPTQQWVACLLAALALGNMNVMAQQAPTQSALSAGSVAVTSRGQGRFSDAAWQSGNSAELRAELLRAASNLEKSIAALEPLVGVSLRQ